MSERRILVMGLLFAACGTGSPEESATVGMSNGSTVDSTLDMPSTSDPLPTTGMSATEGMDPAQGTDSISDSATTSGTEDAATAGVSASSSTSVTHSTGTASDGEDSDSSTDSTNSDDGPSGTSRSSDSDAESSDGGSGVGSTDGDSGIGTSDGDSGIGSTDSGGSGIGTSDGDSGIGTSDGDSGIGTSDGDSGIGSTDPGGSGDTGDAGACGYRTHTQGGWGTHCQGQSPGCYRDAHFATAFPAGLVVGCAVKSATLLNSAAVERALPTGGPPRALLPEEETLYDGSDADPTVKTVFFGQVVALALNVGFDETGTLGELVIADVSSACLGMSVATVLAEANLALGGCASQLSPAELTECATMINESFADGEGMCSEQFTPLGPPGS